MTPEEYAKITELIKRVEQEQQEKAFVPVRPECVEPLQTLWGFPVRENPSPSPAPVLKVGWNKNPHSSKN
jgi:hypothetical protein